MNEKERSCITQSHQAHLASARRRVAELNRGVPFDGPLKGFTGGVKWEADYRSRIKQIALLPVVVSIVLLLAAVTPVMYLVHRWALLQRKRQIVKEIALLENAPPLMDAPDNKDLEHLWAYHGLHGDGHEEDEKVALLNRWVNTLYGDEVAEAYKTHFTSPFDVLLAKLSKALSAYE